MAKLSLSLFGFLLFSCCFAYRSQPQQNECQLDKLEAQEPDHKIQSEAGLIETWNPNNEQFRCAGVALSRCTVQPNGLRLPSYSNAPQLFFIQKGSGVFGIVFPGCAETFQEPQQPESHSRRRSSRSQDRHQKIRHFREHDIIAVPAGVTFWLWNNDNENEVVAISLLDTNSYHNKLDKMPRRFYLAGNQEQEFLKYQEEQQQGGQQGQQSQRQGGKQQEEEEQQQEEEQKGRNVFNGFAKEFLMKAFNIDRETATKMQGQKDKREGTIVKVKGKLSIIAPPLTQEKRQQQEEKKEDEDQKQEQQKQERRRSRKGQEGSESENDNGLEETVCTMRLSQNIGKSTSPDIFQPHVGSLRTVNSLDLPVLKWLSLSAEYGSLHRDVMFVPHYNLNANSIIYALRGKARIQVVDCSGNSVFNKELEADQVLIVPQNFAVAAQAQSDKFEYVAFKTSDNAMMATLAGRTSVLSGIPEEVVAQSYGLRTQQARQIKNNNQYSFLVAPRSDSESERRAVA